MKKLKTIIVIVLMLLLSKTSSSQNKWSVEFRPGLNFATKDIGETSLEIGFGFEINVAYNIMEHLEAYVSWGYNTFASDDNSDTDFDETGYTFGVQFVHSFKESSNLSYLVRAGGIYNHIEVENNNGSITNDTGHGLGWEIGAGLDYNLGESSLSLRPQIGYRALSRDLEIANIKIDIDLNYVTFAVGLIKTF